MSFFSIAIDNIKLSIKAFINAHELIWQKGFWKFFIITAFISTIFFISTFSPAMIYSQSIVNWIFTFIPNSSEIKLIDFLVRILYLLFSIAIRLLILLVYFSIFRNFVMILLSPLMAYIAEKTAHQLGFETNKFDWNIFFKNTWRGVIINIQIFFKELFLILILIIFSFAPGFGIITPLILILVQCYFYGFSMMDYSMELKSYSVNQSISFMQKNKSLAIAIGGIFYIFFLIPYFGWILAPVYGTVAATIAMHSKLKNSNSS